MTLTLKSGGADTVPDGRQECLARGWQPDLTLLCRCAENSMRGRTLAHTHSGHDLSLSQSCVQAEHMLVSHGDLRQTAGPMKFASMPISSKVFDLLSYLPEAGTAVLAAARGFTVAFLRAGCPALTLAFVLKLRRPETLRPPKSPTSGGRGIILQNCL